MRCPNCGEYQGAMFTAGEDRCPDCGRTELPRAADSPGVGDILPPLVQYVVTTAEYKVSHCVVEPCEAAR